MPHHIVIYDQSPSLLTLYHHLLTRRKYRVSLFNHPLQDLEGLKALKPDLIILGYFAGYDPAELELLHQLRQDGDLATLPIIISTTSRDLPHLKAIDDSRITVVDKPFQARDLLVAIRQALGQA